MTKEEVAAIIGYYRSGASNLEIALIMGISESYVEMIIKEYLKGKSIPTKPSGKPNGQED